MPGRPGILSVTISTLLLLPAANASAATPRWECRAGPEGGWQCLKDGVPVAEEQIEIPGIDTEPAQTTPLQETVASEPEPLPDEEAAEQPAEVAAEQPTQPASEPVQPVSEPARPVAEPVQPGVLITFNR